MNILLTGCTGTLGTAVSEALISSGHSVRGLIHGAAIRPGELNERMEIVWGSLRDYKLCEIITEGVDAVVHCAWEGRGAFDGSLETVNVKGTSALIEAAERNGVKTFVHVSSVGIYGLDRSLWRKTIGEEQALVDKDRSLNPYPWVKVLLEKHCEEVKDRLRMNLVVVRPGLLFSERKAPAKTLLAKGNRKYGVLVGSGRNHLPYIHVDDVASLIQRILAKPAKYAVYNCVPSNHVPAATFLKKWGFQSGMSVSVVPIPSVIFSAMNMMARTLKKLLGKESGPSIVKYQVLTGVRDIRYSSDKAIEELGWVDTKTRSITNAG